jgi:hypothetical protein
MPAPTTRVRRTRPAEVPGRSRGPTPGDVPRVDSSRHGTGHRHHGSGRTDRAMRCRAAATIVAAASMGRALRSMRKPSQQASAVYRRCPWGSRHFAYPAHRRAVVRGKRPTSKGNRWPAPGGAHLPEAQPTRQPLALLRSAHHGEHDPEGLRLCRARVATRLPHPGFGGLSSTTWRALSGGIAVKEHVRVNEECLTQGSCQPTV